ncbi:S8 family serine peptidase [Pseudorhodoplanes sp.]|uniref:S8 family serine peptidase n=1 Tax=Pseudorhodoplanes sp. TaxID=1934341 RepID=UPI003D100826
MQLWPNRIAVTVPALAGVALAAILSIPAQAQGYGGYGSGARYTVQSAPAQPSPRKIRKPFVPVDAKSRPAKPQRLVRPATRAVTKTAPKVDPAPAAAANAAAPNPDATPAPAQPRLASGQPPAGERRFVANEVVIEVAGRPTEQEVAALANRHQLNREESQVFDLSGTTMFRWTIPDGRNVSAVIRSLEADASILSVQPNYRYLLQQSKFGEGSQYSLEKLRLARAHEIARGVRVLVAVIDSGIDVSHPELQGTIEDAFNPAGGDGSPHSHGTSVAGAIVAQSELTGVAPASRILAVRAFDPVSGSAEGTTFNILKGLEWSVKRGARVINMSFAGPQDPVMARALVAAGKRGIVLIAAAGNAGPKSRPLFPASDPNVIAVTATDSGDKLFPGSNRGYHVAVAAPGVNVLLPTPGGGYDLRTGTSFAAAHIAGIAALVLERNPDLSPDSVRRVLLSTARDLGTAGRDRDFGAGLADAYEALRSLGDESEVTAGKPDARIGRAQGGR